ncbi:MAG: hypothetical protein ACRCTQ_01210 [Brevinemataceae bacterium]
MEIFIIFSFFFYTGLFFYFRYMDSRNVTIRSLQDYIKQAEKHIEVILKKKEKEFEDKMIASEIVIERMNRLAGTFQEKLEIFDHDIVRGEELFDLLKLECTDISQELFEYKKIRAEFREIEDRMSSVFQIKKQAEEGITEVIRLSGLIKEFQEEYDSVSEELKNQSRQELQNFFTVMQSDLSGYLSKARTELTQKDVEMASQIKELSTASESMSDRIKEFKDFAESSLDKFKQVYDNDLEMLRVYAQTNLEEIYDTWLKLKEETIQDKNFIENDLQQKETIFKEAEERIRMEFKEFQDRTENLSLEIRTGIEFNIQQRFHELDTKLQDVSEYLDKQGETVTLQIQNNLDTHIADIQNELIRVCSAFAEQENSIEDKIKQLTVRINESIVISEMEFRDKVNELNIELEDLQKRTDSVLDSSQQQLQGKIIEFEDGFRQKANENISRLEEIFKEENHKRMLLGVQELTSSIENEYKQRYQNMVDSIFAESEKLQTMIREKLNYADTLGKRIYEMDENFNNEKDKILLMVSELEHDREKNIQDVTHYMEQYAADLQNNNELSLQNFFTQGIEHFSQEREVWQDRFDETLKEARETYLEMQRDVEQIQRDIKDIQTTILGSLRNESERMVQDTERRFEELKRYTVEHMRNSKEEFHQNIDFAKQEIKSLKQELWDHGKEVRDTANKEFERLNIRVKDVDKQFQAFMKKTEKLERAENLMSKLNFEYKEINDLKKEMSSLSFSLKDICRDADDTIATYQSSKQDWESKTENLSVLSSEAGRVQEFLISTVNEAKTVAANFQGLNEEKSRAQEIENLLLKNLELFNDLQDSLQQLESKKMIVEGMMSSIDQSENTLSSMNGSMDDIVNRIQEINRFSGDLKGQLTEIQSEMKIMTGEQTKFHMAVSKLNDLEHMVMHIDEEMKRLEKMRDWIAKAMNNVERIGTGSGVSPMPKNNNSDTEDANVKNILRLYDQNWSINDIAKNLKLSNAFVELILERYRS